jgi:FAD binding domain
MLHVRGGGGHNAAGLGVWDNALVIDLSLLRSTTLSPKDHTVRADAGCTWGDVDHATVAFGMATPSGFLASTVVAGLTLGGGIGYLSRRFGLTRAGRGGVQMFHYHTAAVLDFLADQEGNDAERLFTPNCSARGAKRSAPPGVGRTRPDPGRP